MWWHIAFPSSQHMATFSKTLQRAKKSSVDSDAKRSKLGGKSWSTLKLFSLNKRTKTQVLLLVYLYTNILNTTCTIIHVSYGNKAGHDCLQEWHSLWEKFLTPLVVVCSPTLRAQWLFIQCHSQQWSCYADKAASSIAMMYTHNLTR